MWVLKHFSGTALLFATCVSGQIMVFKNIFLNSYLYPPFIHVFPLFATSMTVYSIVPKLFYLLSVASLFRLNFKCIFPLFATFASVAQQVGCWIFLRPSPKVKQHEGNGFVCWLLLFNRLASNAVVRRKWGNQWQQAGSEQIKLETGATKGDSGGKGATRQGSPAEDKPHLPTKSNQPKADSGNDSTYREH